MLSMLDISRHGMELENIRTKALSASNTHSQGAVIFSLIDFWLSPPKLFDAHFFLLSNIP